LCEGGDTRADSVYSAIQKLDDDKKLVFIHDAARPLIKNHHIEELADACKKNDGAILAHPVSDTLKKIKNDKIEFTIDRSNLWLAETPQAFNLNILHSCYKNLGKKEQQSFTDEASLLEHFGHSIKVIHNRSQNIKITHKEDLDITKGILCKNTKMGIGIDFHSLVDGECLVVGGHKIKCEFASDAHSDGDVLTHAVTDALLGALNLGDIGEHFPNNPEYLNIPSTELLKKILKKVPQNVTIGMIDISVVLNTPKLSPHKKDIKSSLAKVLGINEDIISIKATTTNSLRFLDMSNGWGCEAIVTLHYEN
jgi:2-C-methyl-D-erythritol 4-phosphate cytidylyltransferase/2-C-methyl-D-erythritol 2,4-cyclodiphosphate synthase